MGVVWTHADCFSEYSCSRAGWCQGFVRAAGGSSSHGGGEAAAGCGGGEQWAAARCRQQRGVPCAVEGVSVVAVPSGLRWRCVGADKPAAGGKLSNAKLAGALKGKTAFTAQEWAAFGESVGGKVAVLDCRRIDWWHHHVINNDIQDAIPALTRQGAADVIVIVSDYYFGASDERRAKPRILDQISVAPPFPLMIMRVSEAHVLTATGASIDVFLGAWQISLLPEA